MAARASDTAVRRLAAAGAGTGRGAGHAGGVADRDAAQRQGSQRLVLHHAAAPRGRLARAAGAAASGGPAARAQGDDAPAAPGPDAPGPVPDHAALAHATPPPLPPAP